MNKKWAKILIIALGIALVLFAFVTLIIVNKKSNDLDNANDKRDEIEQILTEKQSSAKNFHFYAEKH